MPLSEEEQRILRQIEEQLQRDPGFARELRPSPAGTRRGLFVAIVLGVLAIALTVFLLSVSPYLAFLAFIGAFVAAVFAEKHLRALGDEALRQVSAMRRNASGGGRQDAG
jgi:Protein of unknown function (DUF3040)